MPTLLYKNALCTWADPQRSERRPKKLWLEPCTSWRFATKQIEAFKSQVEKTFFYFHGKLY